MIRPRGLFGAAIVLYFIIALEVLIMISPFASFFYAAFNPVLLRLAQWPACSTDENLDSSRDRIIKNVSLTEGHISDILMP